MYIFSKLYVRIFILVCFVNTSVSVSAEANVTNLKDDVFDSDIEKHPNFKLLPENCGKGSFADKIIGGNDVEMGQFPWLARMGYKLPRCVKKILYRCGGVLINDLYVVTAAHCATDLPTTRCPVANRTVTFILATIALGEYNSSTDPDCQGNICADPVQIFHPEKIVVHPKYNNPRYSNDICLVRLNRRVTLNTWIAPICLPRGEQLRTLYDGRKAEVAGWGTTNVDAPGSNKIPMIVKLPIVDVQKCIHSFSKPLNLSVVRQMCAGGEENKDSCNGDSGAPLMFVHSYNGEPRYFAIGIVSFGVRHCGKKNKPAIYTRTAGYMSWILSNITP